MSSDHSSPRYRSDIYVLINCDIYCLAEKPPQLVQQYFVVQPQEQEQQQLYRTFGHQPGQPGQITASLAGLPGSRQQQQRQHREEHRARDRPQAHQYENVPEIVIEQPQPHLINCGDSATFQV